MKTRILYAGDSHLKGAAAYLAGVLTHAGLPFDYVSSDEPLQLQPERPERCLYIISDYPVKNMTDVDFRRIISDVEGGGGLLMIGGWESFHGAAGEYHRSPLAEVLPIRMQASDDRVNAPQPCLLEQRARHTILDGLPLNFPPCVGGYNRVRPKADAEVLLAARHLAVEVRRSDDHPSDDQKDTDPDAQFADRYTFRPEESVPLLVVGRHGHGRSAAFTSDVAPHWVGGLVDWGPERVRAQAPGANEIEVGSYYVEFFARLIRWTMGSLKSPS